MSNRHRTIILNSNAPFETENDNNNNRTENNTETTQYQSSVEPNTNPSENTERNTFQIQDSPHPNIFTEPIRNPSLELQQELSEVFPLEKTQALMDV